MPFSARKIHVFATAIVGVQLLVWTTTGLAFTLFDFGAVHGTKDRAPAVAVDFGSVRVRPEEAARTAMAHAASAGVRSVTLETLAGQPTYAVAFVNDSTAVLVSATTGAVFEMDEQRASRIARDAHRVNTTTRTVLRRREDDRDVFVVRLDDARSTDVTVDALTGDVTAWQNRPYRIFDALWSAHVLGYVDRHNPANWPLRVVALFAVVASLSGAASQGGRVRAWMRGRHSPSPSTGIETPSTANPT